MDLLIGTVLFTIFSFCLCDNPSRQITSDLTVTNGAPWGDWGEVVLCPKGFADAFAVKILKYQGSLAWEDDTGMEGVRLHCSDGTTIESSSAQWGTWSDFKKCPKGYLNSFSLRVDGDQGLGDDTAANNIKFKCSDGTVLEGTGHAWGQYGNWSPKCVQGNICGLQTLVDPPEGAGDDTGLNDVKFFCCT